MLIWKTESLKMVTFPINVCLGYTAHCVNQYFHALKDKVAISCYISKSSALQEESIERENIMGIFSFSQGHIFLFLRSKSTGNSFRFGPFGEEFCCGALIDK